jgi:hypothetical protein
LRVKLAAHAHVLCTDYARDARWALCLGEAVDAVEAAAGGMPAGADAEDLGAHIAWGPGKV